MVSSFRPVQDKTVWLVDFGQCWRLSQEERLTWAAAVVGMANSHAPTIASAAAQSGLVVSGVGSDAVGPLLCALFDTR